jgi:predicted anti-sigma-YlaC factor YlaD
MRHRARRLYRRARGYGMRGLEVEHPGLGAALAADPVAALAPMTRDEVPLLYWTAAAWGSEISLAKDDPELAVGLPLAAALMERARELDPSWGLGAIWDFFISYEGRPAAAGGSVEKARAAFDEAMRLARGRRVAPLVSLAEGVAVATQDRTEFTSLLQRALAVDADTTGDQRLGNLIAQKRARWLLAHADDLFIE